MAKVAKIIKLLILISILSSTCLGQVNHLKPEFRNLSWIVDQKVVEVVFTLSKHYGNKSIMTDTAFVISDKYDLYQDSLTLYNLTKDAYKEKNAKAKSTLIGNFTDDKAVHSNAEWLKIFDMATREAYSDNGNSTVGDNSCIPSTYANLKFFYAKESEYIKSYNSGRIKVYQCHSEADYDNKKYDIHIHDKIKYYLAFHKTIQPIDEHAVCYYGIWTPYMYYYVKPKKVVYPASIAKLWEAKTGLPYSVAKELQLTDDRITKILSMPNVINDEVLIKESPVLKQVYDIPVNCDTCNVRLFDNHTEDNDVIDFTYKKETHKVTIKNAGVDYNIILSEDNSFYIFALSEGSLETCTVDAVIDGKNHVFALKKGERVLIKLHKI